MNMAAAIDAPAKCELRSVFCFLKVEGRGASEIQQRTTITKEVYCESLRRLRRAIQNKRRRMFPSGPGVLIYDNGRPNCAKVTKSLLKQTGSGKFLTIHRIAPT